MPVSTPNMMVPVPTALEPTPLPLPQYQPLTPVASDHWREMTGKCPAELPILKTRQWPLDVSWRP